MNGITNDRQVCLTVGADHRLELGDRARRRCRECRCRSSPSARRPRSMAGVSTEACRTYLPSPRAMYSPFWCRRPGLDRPDTIRGPWPRIPHQGRSRIRPAGGRCLLLAGSKLTGKACHARVTVLSEGPALSRWLKPLTHHGLQIVSDRMATGLRPGSPSRAKPRTASTKAWSAGVRSRLRSVPGSARLTVADGPPHP